VVEKTTLPVEGSATGLRYLIEDDTIKVFNTLNERVVEIGPLRETIPFFIVRWYGVMLDDEIKEVLELVVFDRFRASGTRKFLNSNADMQSAWDGINDWLNTDFMPRMIASGLNRLAFVVSQDIFTRISAENFAENMETQSEYLTFCTFGDEASATTWLLDE
jgi:hypothetical protein